MMSHSRFPVGTTRATSDDEQALTGRVIGAAMEVHLVLGPGFLEAVYQEALAHQFELSGVSFEREKEVVVAFKEIEAGRQRLDFVVEGRLIVELKSVTDLSNAHKAQLRSYLKATHIRLGLLINFDHELLQVRRVLNG